MPKLRKTGDDATVQLNATLPAWVKRIAVLLAYDGNDDLSNYVEKLIIKESKKHPESYFKEIEARMQARASMNKAQKNSHKVLTDEELGNRFKKRTQMMEDLGKRSTLGDKKFSDYKDEEL